MISMIVLIKGFAADNRTICKVLDLLEDVRYVTYVSSNNAVDCASR